MSIKVYPFMSISKTSKEFFSVSNRAKGLVSDRKGAVLKKERAGGKARKAGPDFRRVCQNSEILKQTTAATIKTRHWRWHCQGHCQGPVPQLATPPAVMFRPSLMNVRCTRHPHKAAPLLPPPKTKLVAVYNGE